MLTFVVTVSKKLKNSKMETILEKFDELQKKGLTPEQYDDLVILILENEVLNKSEAKILRNNWVKYNKQLSRGKCGLHYYQITYKKVSKVAKYLRKR